jgi:tetratricopeptide (TPR) repeat protein
MANNKKKPAPQKGAAQKGKVPTVEVALKKPSLFGIPFKTKLIILGVISFFLYINTVANEYALDDGIVIVNNKFVQDGFGGIGKIMSHDAYASYYQQMNAGQMLAGGRYRPLSIVVFAIEHAIFGESWPIRHFISILFYTACILSIFYFLSKYLLKKLDFGEDMAFVATLLFAIHPMHTEVVANVKSLDEIMSLLCIMGTFIFSLKYFESKKNTDLIYGLTCYFAALLAKEYAAMLVVLLPLVFYLVANKKPIDAVISSLPYYAVFVLYMMMRIGAVGLPKNVPGTEILNTPYLLATHSQKTATELFVLGKYLYMLFVPYPLASDYSYNTIPYKDFSDISVIFCILIYIGIGALGIILALRKNILSFAVVFYLLNLAMVSNFLLDIGATMGERLAFHSSLGFVIVISYGLFYLTRKMEVKTRKNALITCLTVALVACTAICIPRNAEWKNDVTLFTKDVNTVPNSAMVLGNAGARYIDLAEKSKDQAKSDAYVRQSIYYLAKSVKLYKGYVNSYLNLGVAYYKLNQPDSAKMCWEFARKLYPTHPNLHMYFPLLGQSYLHKAMEIGKNGNLAAAIEEMKKGLPYAPTDASIYYNIGGAYFTIHQYDSARAEWTKALQLKPDYADAKRGLAALPPANK